MVAKEKARSALFALHTVLILAREMANENAPAKLIAEILDTAETLPRLLDEGADRTADFRAHLLQLSTLKKEFSLAVERFDRDAPLNW